MFIARTHELEVLERLYARPKFDMVVLYGRRRVGKTALMDQFVADKEALYFTALQQKQQTQSARLHIRSGPFLQSSFRYPIVLQLDERSYLCGQSGAAARETIRIRIR